MLVIFYSWRNQKLDSPTKNHNGTPFSRIESGYIGKGVESWRKYFDCMNEAFDVKITTTSSPMNKYQPKPFKLPQSYIDFVAAGGIEYTNELAKAVNHDLPDALLLLPESLDRFKILSQQDYMKFSDGEHWYGNPEDIEDEYYYKYDDYKGMKSSAAEPPHVKNSNINFIQIGQMNSNIYGLVDHEITQDGEFEAWSFLKSGMGAYRFRSFAEMYIFDIMGMLKHFKDGSDYRGMSKVSCTNLILDLEALEKNAAPMLSPP